MWRLATMLITLSEARATCIVRHERYGHIQSEDGDYENFAETCWLLQPRFGTQPARSVTLSFQQFAVEEFFDKLHVYDGDSEVATQLTPAVGLSGYTLPSPITSSGGSMLVKFRSDFSNRAAGFTFAWTSSDGSVLPAGSCATDCASGKQHDQA